MIKTASGLLSGTLLLIGLSFGVGLGVNAVRSDGRSIPLLPRYLTETNYRLISLAEAARLYRGKKPEVVFLDARVGLAYKKNHIKDAFNLFPANVYEAERDPATGSLLTVKRDYFPKRYALLKTFLPKAGPIVVYGRTLSYHLAAHLAWRLVKIGHVRVMVLDAGLDDWEAAGLPVSRPKSGKRGSR